MNAVHTNDDTSLFAHVESLMTEHGLWPMLSATARAALQRRRQRRKVHSHALSDHMLRDIGLHPAYRPGAD